MNHQDIDQLLEDNSLVLTKNQTETNPFMPGEKDDMYHWFCTLSGPAIEHFEFYVSCTPEIDPTDTDMLNVLVKDIKTYRGCEGYEDFLKVFGIDDGEDRAEVALAWQELGRLAPLVEQVVELVNDDRRRNSIPSATAPSL
jgi:hypothetical protein